MNRRIFIKSLLGTLSAFLLSPIKAFSLDEKTKAATSDVVALDSPTAKALGYVHDATKADIAKFPKRATAEGKTQFCSNCSFAQGEPADLAGQEGKWQGCTLFPGKKVATKGWCNSWMKKAA